MRKTKPKPMRAIKVLPANPGPERSTIIRTRNEWLRDRPKKTTSKQEAIIALGGTIE